MLIEGVVGVQKEAVLAVKRSIVTVEEIVEELNAHANACVPPNWTVNAICTVPGGAHPSYAHGYYRRDNASYMEWDRISANREEFLSWMDLHVLGETPEVFASRVSRLETSL